MKIVNSISYKKFIQFLMRQIRGVMNGLNNDRNNQSSSAIVKKLDFTLLFAKYYLYINKLAPKDLSLDEFKAKISWRYDFEKPPPSIS